MVNVRLFGCIEVSSDDSPAVRIGAAKARWLLAFLALDVGRSRSVESIIGALWGEHAPASAANLVHGYISDLRKVIGHEHIQTTDSGYALLVDGDSVDLMQFHALHEQALTVLPTDAQAALALIEEALDLAAEAPFGENPPDGPLAAAATRLAEQRVDALELHTQMLVSVDQHRKAVTVLDELVQQHPYREGLWVTLALALYRCDRQVDALRRITEARRILEDDLGISPGWRLIEIEHQILNHEPTLSAASTAVISPSTQPAVVGRSAELARLGDRLTQVTNGAQQAIFIGGEPGIGKTTVAQELLRTAKDEHTVVLIGHCDEHVAVPYRPFVEALTDHLRSIGETEVKRLLQSVGPR